MPPSLIVAALTERHCCRARIAQTLARICATDVRLWLILLKNSVEPVYPA